MLARVLVKRTMKLLLHRNWHIGLERMLGFALCCLAPMVAAADGQAADLRQGARLDASDSAAASYDSNVFIRIHGYDLEGQLGVERVYPFIDSGWTSYEIGTPCFISVHNEIVGLAASHPCAPHGTPFTFKSFIPGYGPIAGRNITDLNETVIFVIPVKSSEIEMREMYEFDYGRNQAGFGILPTILDTFSSPSIAVPSTYYNEMPPGTEMRGATYVIEYLPGNALEHVGSHSWRFEPGDLKDSAPAGYWGWQTTPLPSSPILSSEVPEGPIRISFSVDGYTTDTLVRTVVRNTAFYWHSAHVSLGGPEGGPTATELAGPGRIVAFGEEVPPLPTPTPSPTPSPSPSPTAVRPEGWILNQAPAPEDSQVTAMKTGQKER